MSELRYERITVDRADELAAIEHTVFTTIDAEDLYDADGVAKLAANFPEGNFMVLDGDRAIGIGLGLLVDFSLDAPDHTLSEIAGDDGASEHDADNPWYYGTSIAVLPEYRGRGIGRRLYDLRKQCVRDLGKRGIVAGGVLPGYAEHKSAMTADEYIDRVKAGELYDPTLTFQLENGFVAHHALPGYLADDTVDGNSVLIVWHNPDLADTVGA
jgi:GNAT superfamily N-acetyltransferase